MAYSQGRNFLFCNYCGTMLTMEAMFVACPLCKFKRNAEGTTMVLIVPIFLVNFPFLYSIFII